MAQPLYVKYGSSGAAIKFAELRAVKTNSHRFGVPVCTVCSIFVAAWMQLDVNDGNSSLAVLRANRTSTAASRAHPSCDTSKRRLASSSLHLTHPTINA
eukprot:6186848-Pleurochrysis_carterae.AAC.1